MRFLIPAVIALAFASPFGRSLNAAEPADADLSRRVDALITDLNKTSNADLRSTGDQVGKLPDAALPLLKKALERKDDLAWLAYAATSAKKWDIANREFKILGDLGEFRVFTNGDHYQRMRALAAQNATP